MKIHNFNLYFLLFLFVLSLFLSTSNQTARWGLAPDETFGFSLFVFFFILLSNSVITVITKSKMKNSNFIATILTKMIMLIGGGAFAFILSFAIHTKNHDYRFYWMFGTLAIIYIAGITTYARLKKYKSNNLISHDS